MHMYKIYKAVRTTRAKIRGMQFIPFWNKKETETTRSVT